MPEWIKDAPSLLVVVFLTLAFLKHLKDQNAVHMQREKEREEAQERREIAWTTFIQRLHDEHLGARGESRATIKENTESNLAVATTNNSIVEGIKELAVLLSKIRETKMS